MTNEKAISTIENAKNFAYDDVYEEAFNMAINALKEPRKGHWIPHTDRGMIECSKCHAEERTAHLLHSNFCPNCGTKMAESEG